MPCGSVAVRAITGLVALEGVLAQAVQTDAVDVLKGMLNEFKSQGQFVFRAQKLLATLEEATPAPAASAGTGGGGSRVKYTDMENRVIANLLDQVDALKAEIAVLEAQQ